MTLADNDSPSPFQKWIRDSFSLDLRALSLLRIGLGILILVDLLSRSRWLEAHYTENGVLPFSRAVSRFLAHGHISLHGFLTELWQVQAIFLIHGLLALLLVLGVWTRPLIFLNWLLLVSLQQRNPLILYGGDTLLRVLLFWSFFLPLDAHWSLRGNPRREKSILSCASLAFILQLVILYWFTCIGKRGPAWTDGTALSLVFQYESFATPLAVMLRGGLSPDFSYWSSRLVVWFEFLGPLAWFFPIYEQRVRTAFVCSFILMHLIFGTFIVLDLFPLVNFVSLFPLFPSNVWDAIFPPRRSASDNPPERSQQSRAETGMQAVCALSFIYLALWNLARLPGHETRVLPLSWEIPAEVFWLKQNWAFFEPDPPRDGGWYVMPGKTRAGRSVDVFRETFNPVVWVKPEFVSEMMPSARWVKVYSNLWLLSNESLRAELARYLCLRWNRKNHGEEALASFEIYYLFYAPVVGAEIGEALPQTTLVWKTRCE